MGKYYFNFNKIWDLLPKLLNYLCLLTVYAQTKKLKIFEVFCLVSINILIDFSFSPYYRIFSY